MDRQAGRTEGMVVKRIVNGYFDVLGWVNQKMGAEFVGFHKWLFAVLVGGGALLGAFRQLLTQQITFASFVGQLQGLFITWGEAAAISTVAWMIFRSADLDLWLYYFVIVPILAETRLGELLPARELARVKDIQASKSIHAEGYELPNGSIRLRYPSFIRREHLERRSFWPHWVFAIVTIFNERSLSTVVEERDGKKNWTLAVDLRDESYGIYSNRGKRFLSSRFHSAIENYRELSEQTRKRFLPDAAPGTTPVISGASIPMRWASGGFLPLVAYQSKTWVALFFRDIFPIGWNAANGATENKDEYKSLNRLIRREFSEEMILLPGKPCAGTEMTQVMFESVLPNTNGSTHQEYREADFVRAHAALRQRHDDFQLFIPPEGDERYSKRRIHPLNTPFKVRVTYHRADLHRAGQENVEFVIPSINPRETGIETIWLCGFEMSDGEYLIDGEYDLARNYLIRQPVVLLDMDYLKRIHARTGGLGEMVLNQTGFDDVKRLPPIPAGHFHIFDADVEFRRRRLATLERLSAAKDVHAINASYGLSTAKAQDAMTKEMTRMKTWLADYEDAFARASNGGKLDDARLRCLCPVTWKTLELIFAHRIDYRGFAKR
ncbi:MAG: hypothetical protein ACM3MF_05755 [Anaerolineae bacterium]